jgi:hypothetical protein
MVFLFDTHSASTAMKYRITTRAKLCSTTIAQADVKE